MLEGCKVEGKASYDLHACNVHLHTIVELYMIHITCMSLILCIYILATLLRMIRLCQQLPCWQYSHI